MQGSTYVSGLENFFERFIEDSFILKCWKLDTEIPRKLILSAFTNDGANSFNWPRGFDLTLPRHARKFTDYLSGAGNIGHDPTKYELSILIPKNNFRQNHQNYNSFEID